MDEKSLSEHQKAASYFDRRGELFDSLYSNDRVSPLMRFLNQRFRSDIYERYRLTVAHLRQASAKTVLDIGIGSGRYAQGYLEAGITRVLGVDISRGMLEMARRHVKDFPGSEKIFEFVQADIDDFESAERFDVVVAMGFFDYTPDPKNCLERMFTFCNHSVIASFPSVSFYRTPLRKLRYKLKKCPVFFYTPAELEKIANAVGFRASEVTKIKGAGMDYVAKFLK